jgi:hypothetical protein
MRRRKENEEQIEKKWKKLLVKESRINEEISYCWLMVIRNQGVVDSFPKRINNFVMSAACILQTALRHVPVYAAPGTLYSFVKKENSCP